MFNNLLISNKILKISFLLISVIIIMFGCNSSSIKEKYNQKSNIDNKLKKVKEDSL